MFSTADSHEELINIKIYLVTYVVSSCHVSVNISSRTCEYLVTNVISYSHERDKVI